MHTHTHTHSHTHKHINCKILNYLFENTQNTGKGFTIYLWFLIYKYKEIRGYAEVVDHLK